MLGIEGLSPETISGLLDLSESYIDQNRSLDTPTPEEAYVADVVYPGAVDSRNLSIDLGATNNTNRPRPKVRRGSWVLDATMYDSSGTVSPQGRFYRVVNVEEGTGTGGAAQFTLELQTPLAGDPKLSQRVLVVMDQVVEVFLKDRVSQDSPPQTY